MSGRDGAVYADGGVFKVNPSPVGGMWAWCAVNADGERYTFESGILRPADLGVLVVTNNQTEYFALLSALEAMPEGWSGRACSDSGVTLGRMFSGHAMKGIPGEWLRAARRALARLGAVTPVLLNGHPTRAELAAGVGKRGHPVSEHNVYVDKLCRLEAAKFEVAAWITMR